MPTYFVDEHDFNQYPELSDAELAIFGFMSPHVQIEEDFEGVVIRVHDGDTLTIRTDFRDFDFPVRLLSIDAPELNTGVPGAESRDFARDLVEGEAVTVRIDRSNRVDKYGRLLGDIIIKGINLGDALVNSGHAVPFAQRLQAELPDLNKVLRENRWF